MQQPIDQQPGRFGGIRARLLRQKGISRGLEMLTQGDDSRNGAAAQPSRAIMAFRRFLSSNDGTKTSA